MPKPRAWLRWPGGILQDSGYNEVWTEARMEDPAEAQCRSPLGRRPYGLRTRRCHCG